MYGLKPVPFTTAAKAPCSQFDLFGTTEVVPCYKALVVLSPVSKARPGAPGRLILCFPTLCAIKLRIEWGTHGSCWDGASFVAFPSPNNGDPGHPCSVVMMRSLVRTFPGPKTRTRGTHTFIWNELSWMSSLLPRLFEFGGGHGVGCGYVVGEFFAGGCHGFAADGAGDGGVHHELGEVLRGSV